jgi:hypothetical protein
MAFGIAYVLFIGGASSRVMQSFHGLHHSAYVYQIVNGIIPPTNPSSLGEPANFYWVWHACLALGVRIFDRTPFEMSLVSNALGLAGFLVALWLATGHYTRNTWLRLAVCGVPFFILNPLGLIQFALRLAGVWLPEIYRAEFDASTGALPHLVEIARYHPSLEMVDHSLVQLSPRLGLFESVELSDRAGHLINKFLNFNSFPIALAVFATGQWLLLHVRGRTRLRAVLLAGASFVMAVTSPLTAVAFGMTVAAFALVEGLEWSAVRGGGEASPARIDLQSIVTPVLGCGVGVLLALPLLLPVASAYQGRATILTQGNGLFAHAVLLGWALVPVFLLLGLAVFRRSHLPASARVHALSACAYGLAAMLLVAPVGDPNEYKFALLSAFPSALLLLALLSTPSLGGQGPPGDGERRTQVASLVLGLMAVLSLCVMALLYHATPWSQERQYVLRGTTTELHPSYTQKKRDLSAAYAWLRTSTPVTAHVFVPALAKDESLIPVIAQRRVVAQLASPFTRAVSHHEALLAVNQALLRGAAACEFGATLVEDLRALPVDWPDDLYALVETSAGMAACREGTTAGLALAYSNQTYAVYRVSGF